MTILYISMIVAFGAMGVGYAYWNSGLNVNLSLETGFTNPLFYVEDDRLNKDDGKLEFTLSEDKEILRVEGEIYPSFNEDIEIRVVDEGSIPSVFNDIEKDDSEISDIENGTKSKYGRMSNIRNDYLESFNLNINSSYHSKEESNNMSSRSSSDESLGLEGDIKRLKDEIRAYNRKEDYRFKYKLLFEQGL
jgi:hypothetical protein